MPATCSRKARAWEGEQVVLAVAHAGEVHRQAAGQVGVRRPHQHMPVALGHAVGGAVDEAELPGPCRVAGDRARLREQLVEAERVRQAVGDPGGRQRPGRPEIKVAVRVTRSSFSTGSRWSPTSTAAWPTAVPSGERALGDDGL
jgi:hypothetical protein